ncbi:Endonuclease/exonuclease/phosphatase, partial [Mycena crocata]
MRGRFHKGEDKWIHINQIMRDRQIGLMALQETHLSPSDTDSLNSLFERNLSIYSTIDPANPSGKGVAIVLNKQMTNVGNIKAEAIIEGRALMVTVPWHANLQIRVLAVYSPNDPTENANFLQTLRDKLAQKPRPDFVLGDFNMVEEAIDRLPHHSDPLNVSDAMADFKNTMGLCDGFRLTHPDVLSYSFHQKSTGSQSRIDRILVPDALLPDLSDWEMDICGLPTDHKLVSVKFSSAKLPYIGRGRWSMPLHALKDKETMDKINSLGKSLAESVELCRFRRSESNNAQVLFKKFKDDVVQVCRERSKKMMPAIERDIEALKSKLFHVLNNNQDPEDEKILAAEMIQE